MPFFYIRITRYIFTRHYKKQNEIFVGKKRIKITRYIPIKFHFRIFSKIYNNDFIPFSETVPVIESFLPCR